MRSQPLPRRSFRWPFALRVSIHFRSIAPFARNGFRGFPLLAAAFDGNSRDKEGTRHVTTSKLLAGASGYSFKEWKGDFYPEKIKPEEMLAYYAERLRTGGINNTFYRMPKLAVLASWAGSTTEGFRFAI